jgi:hypothetical protein
VRDDESGGGKSAADADHSPAPTVEIKIKFSHILINPYAFIAQEHSVYSPFLVINRYICIYIVNKQ